MYTIHNLLTNEVEKVIIDWGQNPYPALESGCTWEAAEVDGKLYPQYTIRWNRQGLRR